MRRKGVATVSASLGRGGAELRTLEVVTGLSDDVEDIYVVLAGRSSGPRDLERQFIAAGAAIVNAPLRRLAGWVRLIRLLRRVRVIHSQLGATSGPLLAVAWLVRTPVRVAHFHSDALELPSGALGRAARVLGSRLVQWFATNIVGISHAALDGGYGRTWRGDDRVEIVAPGIDLQAFRDVSSGDPFEAVRHDGSRIVLHVGRDIPSKNRLRAIEILAELVSLGPRTKLIFVGSIDGDSQRMCEQRARELGVAPNVSWWGVTSEIPVLMRHADLMLVTSDIEGIPGTIIEAVASNLPVVATDLPGVRRLVDIAPDLVITCNKASGDSEWADTLFRVITTHKRYETNGLRSLEGTEFDASVTVESFRRLWGVKAKQRVVHLFSSLDYGGAEMRTLELFRFLSPIRYELVMLQTSGIEGPLTAEFEALGVRVHTVRFRSLRFLFAVHALLREGRAQAVHVHVMRGHERAAVLLFLACLYRVPVRVLHYRNEGEIRRRGTGWAAEQVWHFLGARFSTVVAGVSPQALEVALTPWRFRHEEERVLLPGLDVERFAENGRRSEHLANIVGASTSDRFMLVLGRDDPQKDRERSIRVFDLVASRIPDVRLALVGKTSRTLSELLDAAGIGTEHSSRMHVIQARDDVPEILAATDLMLLTSRHEGLPGVVLEALAAGTPVVASSLPGTRFIAQEVDGLITVELDAYDEEWAESIVRLLDTDAIGGRRPPSFRTVQDSIFAMKRVAPEYERVWRV